jgi:ABC-type polysaccharide/polyol phosphate export permease
MISFNCIQAELYKTYIIFKRNYFRFFDITAWPIILFFSITLFLNYVNPSPQIMSMAITGLIGWRAVYHFQIESNLSYMDDYWGRSISQQLASPLKLRESIISGIISGGIKFLCVLGVYLFFAMTIYSFKIVDMFKFIIGISYLCFVGLTIGIIVFSFLIRYRDKAITFAFIIPDLFVLLSGVYYPISIFPKSIVYFAHLLPTFYGFELLKSMVGLGQANYFLMIVVGLIWFVLALLLLKYSIKKAKIEGSFSNFN